MKALKLFIVIAGLLALTGFGKSDLQQAREHFLKGELPQAVDSFTKAIESNPDEVDAYFSRGASYSALGLFDEAIEDYNKVLELDPKHPEANWSRGYCYQNKRMDDKAISDYTESLRLGTKKASLVYLLRAGAYFRQGIPDKAEEDIRLVIKLEPGNKRAVQALEDIKRAKADPDFDPHALKFRPIEEQPKYGDGPLSPAVQEANDRFVTEVMLGYDTKEEAVRDGLELAWSFYYNGDFGTAMRRFNQAWLINGDNPEIFHGYSMVLKAWGYDAEADRWEKAAKDAGYREASEE